MNYLVLFTALLLALVPFASAQAQSPPLNVEEVRIDGFPRIVVRLRESPDAAQAALQLDQLAVSENGQAQQSADVRQLRNVATPTSIALAIDVSGSMSEQDKFTAAQSAAKAFVAQMRPIDKVVTVSFADEVRIPQPLTADRQLLNRSIDQLTPGGNTRLYDAVAQGLGQLSSSPSGSRALIVLTDGNDTASERLLADGIAQAIYLAVPIYAIGLGADADTKVLEQFASETGGHYYSAPTGRDLTEAFRLISRQLNAEYQVSWVSTSNLTTSTDVPVQISFTRADGTESSAALSYSAPAYAVRAAPANPIQTLAEIRPTSAPTEQQVLIAGVLAGVGVFLFTFGMVRSRMHRRLQARLVFVSGHPVDVQAGKFTLRRSHLNPVTATTATLTGRLLPRKFLDWLRHRLVQAGYPSDRHLGLFLAAQGSLAVMAGSAVYLLLNLYPIASNFPARLLVIPTLAALLGVYLPYVWLRRRFESRQQAIMRALPDALDLMVISVTAGLSVDTAMSEVVLKWDGYLSREFNQVLNEMRMGIGRRDALNNLADRLRIQDIQLLVAALLQADELGSSISETLSTQADQLRIRRHYIAEERARKAPVKMLIPLTLLIFPAMFAILLMPSVLQITTVMKGGFGRG